MQVQFVWAISTQTVPREEVERKIREDVEVDTNLRPCHPGPITAQITGTDPIEVSIQGQLLCKCRRTIAKFTGASDGSTLTYTD